MGNNSKRIVCVGLGYWGKNVARNLHEIGVLYGVSEIDKSNPLIKQYIEKGIRFYENYEDVLLDENVDAVAIATPAVTHFELAKKSLIYGKDVFVEKPIALRVSDAKELVQIATENKKILMVGHVLQYHPAVKKLKEIISSGKLGKIEYIYSNRLNIGKLRTEENILWSFAPHDISLILSIVGQMPQKVFSMGEDYITKGVYDVTITLMDFAKGLKAHIFVSWLHPYKEQKLIIVCSGGMIVFDDVSKEKLFLYPHKIKWEEGKIPVAEKADYETISFENGEPLKLELLHFVECIKERKKPITDGEEGLRVLKVLEAAEESLKKGSAIEISDKKYFVHPTAIVEDGTEIGEGTKIWQFSHIRSGTKIGRNCIIGKYCEIGPDVVIGNRCKIQNNISIYKGVILEDEVFCGPSCVFTNVYNPRAFIERKNEFMNTYVGKGATIGANSTIVCGVKIGKYAMIGAGAVIKKDVPDYALVVGVPARQIGWVCKCGVTLKFIRKKATCSYCGNQYVLEKNTIKPIKEK